MIKRLRAKLATPQRHSDTSLPMPQIEIDQEARYRPISIALVRRMLQTLAKYRNQYALGILLGLTFVLLDQQGPRLLRTIINASSVSQVAQTILIWAVIFTGSVIFQRWTILIMTRAGESVQFDIRQRLFDHLQRLSMSYYDKTKLGRIISRMTSDIGALREINVWGLFNVVAWSSMMLFAAAMMAIYADWRLFISVAWLAPVLFWLNRSFLRNSAGAYQMAREGWTRVSTNMAENITGMRVVTAFNRQDPNLAVFDRLQVANTANNVTVARYNGLYQPLLQTVGYVGKAIILIYGGYLCASGRMTHVENGVVRPDAGGVAMAFMYWDSFMNPILLFGNFYNQLMMAMAGAERIFDLLDTNPDVTDSEQAITLPRIVGKVELENVTFGYNPERPVLHDVSFTANPGQMFALVGSTGSGKSSIVSLIARFYQPQKGRVLVDGYDLRHVTGESLHKQMGLVLQVNYLFSGTVMENIRYASPSATREDVIAAARAIGSHDAIESLQNGYDSEVGERGSNMSLGQRQLICFTRAFLADPRIFMLDEATSAVDTATELLVQQSLEKLLEGRTTFVVAHRLSTIMRADCILVIDQGHIIERGTHRELLAADGRYAHLYRQFVLQNE